jgi:hypothetical protein
VIAPHHLSEEVVQVPVQEEPVMNNKKKVNMFDELREKK